MKRLFKLMTLGFSIVISGGYAVAQSTNPPPPDYHFCPDILQENSLKSMNCSGISTTDYENKYSWQSTYIPDSHTPVKVIKIAFHFFQDANGGNMWPDNQATRNTFTALVATLNSHKSAISSPVSPINGVMHIVDSRIQFECTGFYFYQNDTLNQIDSVPSKFEAHIASIDPDRLNSLGIFYTGSTYQAGAGNYASGISNGPWGPSCSIVMYNTGLYGTGEGTLDHELGHSFGLWHTYNSETILKTDKEYLSDVFNVPWGNYCSPPPNMACYHEGSWNWDPSDRVAHPHCTNNLMGGCLYSWYMSPLQIGRTHRGLALLGIRKYVKEMTSEATYPWIITSNETWDFNIQMYQDIVVKSGNTLTIKCMVGMANNGRIIVERGARLIIDGGEVYPWGTSWEGIQVWGTSSQRQTINSNGLSTYQGIVKVINGGTLRRARNAIVTTKAAPNGDLDWGGYFGGIVQCDGANFINNHVSVAFMTHHNYVTNIITRNLSYINRSIFEVDNDMGLHEPADPYLNTFVSLWGVEGVNLQGNTYRNNCNPLPAVENRGYGVVGYDGSFTLSRYKICSSWSIGGICNNYSVDVASQFENLYYGVHVTESAPLAAINVYENDFINCTRAVYMSGTHNTKIQYNQIDIGDGSATENPYGIYSDWSTAYEISNNQITDGATMNNQTTGIYIYETGGLSNMIYRNKMDNLHVGTTVMGDNRGQAAGEGLRFQCNEYGQSQQNSYDIWLNNQGSYYNPAKIDAVQGSSTKGANNRFSHYPANFRDYYSPNYSPVTYYFNPEASTATQPIYYSVSLATSQNATALDWPTMCPENRFSIATTGGTTLHNRLSALATLDATSTSLTAQIDNNSTQWFLDAISGAITVPANDIKTALVNASPYLSDAVLIAVIMSPIVTPDNIASIHKKNAPVTQPVMEAILSLSLSSTVMSKIYKEQERQVPSERAKLESQIASVAHQREFELNEGLKELLNDSTGYVPDSLLLLIQAGNNDAFTTNRLASFYAATNQLLAGQELFQTLKEPTGELTPFCRVQEIVLDLKQTERNVFTLKTNTDLKEELEMMADDQSNPAHVHAQALLSLVFGTRFTEYTELPAESAAKGLALPNNNQLSGGQEAATKNMLIYPNPSSGKIMVSHFLEDDFYQAELIVYGVNGNQMLRKSIDQNNPTTELSTENLEAGVYFVYLTVDGQHVETQKFIKK